MLLLCSLLAKFLITVDAGRLAYVHNHVYTYSMWSLIVTQNPYKHMFISPKLSIYFSRPPFGPTFGSGLAGVEICHGNTTLLNYTLSPGN